MPAARRTAPPPAMLALALLGAATLAGCGPAAQDEATTQEPPSAEIPTAIEPEYAFSADNCGFDVELDSPPQRIVTIKSSTTELVLALGAAERLVGVAYLDGPVPGEHVDLVAALPLLADRVPSHESVLAQEPDLVYAGWESNFSAEGAGERSTFADLGIATFVAPSACQGEGYQPNPLTFDDVFAEITQVGDLLDAPEEAEALVADHTARLSAIEPVTTGLSALWFSSGSDTPYIGAGIGSPQMLMDAVGLANIADDVPETWTSMSWEAVADRDPDVIVLVDAAWNTASSKIELLQSNPVTSQLDAVREERFLIVPFAATEAGVRSIEGVEILAGELAALSERAE